MAQAKTLQEYFQENWDRKPYPVIDHLLRIDKLPDGSFHFYIHPANTDGITTDFIANEKGVELRAQSQN